MDRKFTDILLIQNVVEREGELFGDTNESGGGGNEHSEEEEMMGGYLRSTKIV